MIPFKKLSRDEAKKILTEFDNYSDLKFRELTELWSAYDPACEIDEHFKEFRRELVEVFRSTRSKSGGKTDYLVDLNVGLKLYSLLPAGKEFTVVAANDDDFWRYISIKVIPDLTYIRYPLPEKDIKDSGGRLNHKRFYAQPRRIWIKSLWWYVHLSWQGDEEKTFEALKNNSVDNINKLIETPGRGYRIDLYRAMIAEYAATGPHHSKEFAAFTKMNNARCVTVEPALTSGGVEGYSHRLFEELKERKEKNDTD